MQSKIHSSSSTRLAEEAISKDVEAALTTSHAIASVGIATLNMLETLLPAAADEVEKESHALAENFMKLIHGAQIHERLTRDLLHDLRTIAPVTPEVSNCIRKYEPMLKQAAEASAETSNAAKGIVICMQFQDRNTQVMQNVVSILERYRTMLEDICGNITSMQDGRILGNQTISQAVDSILSGIRLSDIRTRYLEALKKARVSSHDSTILSALGQDIPNDIELF